MRRAVNGPTRCGAVRLAPSSPAAVPDPPWASTTMTTAMTAPPSSGAGLPPAATPLRIRRPGPGAYLSFQDS